MRGTANGDDIGCAVTVEVATAQVLGGDVLVEHSAVPFPARSVKVIYRDSMIGASVACEELIVAVAINIGHPESVAIRKS